MEALKSTASTAAAATKRTLGPAPPTDAYLTWDAPGVEKPHLEGEEETTKKIAGTMNAMQRHNFDQVKLPL